MRTEVGDDGVVREYYAPSSEYDNIADRTAGEMMGEYLERAYSILKQTQPDCSGFVGIVMERPNGDTRVSIDILEGSE